MKDFRPVTLEDKQKLDGFFKKAQYENSELCFGNMFLWADSWDIRYHIDGDILLFTGVGRNGQRFFFTPVIKRPEIICDAVCMMQEYSRENHFPFLIKVVPESVKDTLLDHCSKPQVWRIEEDRDNFDYVYLSRDLIELKGSRYHAKRNHINRLTLRHDYQFKMLTDELVQPCLENYMQWYERHIAGDPTLEFEKSAVFKGLEHWKELGFIGGAILINDRVEAFTLGEQLTEDMAVIHIEKANTDIQGLYPLINQQFAQYALAHLTYINREEDMGIPGLRRSKKSYYPVRMIKKYNVTRREGMDGN
ncbi:MAG: DUF2156 domain-containing protein [Christensenellales bacterium]|jgi:hypothetical protein